jgi:ATP-dependent helicase/DNAse subunit B
MGMLETRLLDFENVFILSVNEGILPPEAGSSSFIPYSLKKAFRLPVPEDIEADYAYYFYRLLQKAENVTLIYNTETGVIKAGEKSRFIMQVVNELAEENKNIKIEELLLSGDIELPVRKEISIEKTDEVIKILKDQKQYSATTILSYINCPLQFYFKKAAGLKEEDEVEEYFSAAAFGNIFHQVMEDLYTGDTGRDVTAEMIDEKLSLAKNNFDELWKAACSKYEEYAEFSDVKLGKNLLYKRVIQKLVQKVLQADKEQAPFKILALETEAEKS